MHKISTQEFRSNMIRHIGLTPSFALIYISVEPAVDAELCLLCYKQTNKQTPDSHSYLCTYEKRRWKVLSPLNNVPLDYVVSPSEEVKFSNVPWLYSRKYGMYKCISGFSWPNEDNLHLWWVNGKCTNYIMVYLIYYAYHRVEKRCPSKGGSNWKCIF